MADENATDAPQDEQPREGGVPFAASGLTDSGGLSDDVTAVLNPAAADAEQTARLQGGEHAPTRPLPVRPGDSASKDEWLGYVTALGADRGFVDGQSEHWRGTGYVQATGMTVEELKRLAGWLGG